MSGNAGGGNDDKRRGSASNASSLRQGTDVVKKRNSLSGYQQGNSKRVGLVERLSSEQKVDWWNETEHTLMKKLQHGIFSARGEQVAFLCKVLKPRKSAKSQKDLKEQVLVVCKTVQANKQDDICIHVLTLKGWSIRLTESIKTLTVIDGDPSIPYTNVFDGMQCKLMLEFNSRGARRLCYWIMSSAKEKNILEYCLVELCERYFEFRPKLVNVKESELKLVGTEEVNKNRCILLTDQVSLKGREDDSDTENVDSTNGGGPGKSTSTQILSQEEQEELLQILESEDLLENTAGTLSEELLQRISLLENETGDTLRQWENRGDSTDYVGSNPSPSSQARGGVTGNGKKRKESVAVENITDPIAALVDQLEEVYAQLNGVDEWMSKHNMELRTMRKDIHKIEHENNRLQMLANNQGALRIHLAKLLSHYAITPEATEVVATLDQILKEDVLGEAERGNPPRENTKPALVRVTATALQLHLALQGKAHAKPGKEAECFVEEPYLNAIKQRQAELQGSIEKFCGLVHFYIAYRIKHNADAFRDTIKTIKSATTHDMPSIEQRDAMHKTLAPYASLINSLQLLDEDGFEKIVSVYVDDMGSSYGDVARNFFAVMMKLLSDGTFGDFALSNAQEAQLRGYKDEITISNQYGAKLCVAMNRASSAHSFSYCLEQIIPMILSEQAFLGETFWHLSSYDSPQAMRSLITERTTKANALIERDEALNKIFNDKGAVLQSLTQFVQRGSSSVPQLISMIVDVEALIMEYKKSCKFLLYILAEPTVGTIRHLGDAFSTFIDSQVAWFESMKVDPIKRKDGPLLPVLKLPRFVDHILGTWDACVQVPRKVCSSQMYDKQSNRFEKNTIGRGLVMLFEKLFKWIDRVAAMDPRKTDLIRLENYFFFKQTFTHRKCAVLPGFVNEAQSRFKDSLERLIESSMKESYPVLIGFVSDVEILLEQYDKSQIAYHKTRIQLANVMQKVTGPYIKQQLASLKGRVTSHLSYNIALEKLVIGRLAESIVSRYQRYVQLIQDCYGDIVSPTVEEISTVLDEVRK
uniref:Exocyst complex component Sec3 PIP2-binding N-terminal domain-containing protein n=1 Tax=Mucochytrium quahogii TaxID=96639 RepID=A0A7S2WNQ9_9STRA|mmetsp:Transcript_1501/g.2217  ORF Transcript_1501/g.2217 Transcript_1501/m.2217 type:complete len:1042 (+) Transcript_1501:170-3295(+)|eukprot:CAMPEP_0203753762 /NCGR_PEP_ID=MMETSP0098-20131031/7482_1 /ASSEMBLY_ACC=CAM_ASM_000208 /TAXON_ID=96639 /ORGANISM=" , Strain NY0313808BC1" /LENGTH=1041 /DNA_ID=CAMNT_0050644505 /DNA_START=87 /DNA_END=3212 /DNA_ORIENTATION=+